jgi:hypothetical protein
MHKSKYMMLEIFNFAYGAVETVLTMRLLSKRMLALSQDPYISKNFKANNYSGVSLDVRHINDVALLAKAQRYSEIINAAEFLNVDVFYEFPKDRSLVRDELHSIVK